MRHDETWRVDHLIVIEDQIQVERTRRAGKRSLAAKFLLDVEQRGQQIARGQRGLPDRRRIEKDRLLTNTHRRCVVKAGCLERLDGGAQRLESRAEVRVAIAEIAAECDRDFDDGLLLPPRGQHDADPLSADRALADHVFHAGGCLLEQTLMLD